MNYSEISTEDLIEKRKQGHNKLTDPAFDLVGVQSTSGQSVTSKYSKIKY
jgi:hypothetical protein